MTTQKQTRMGTLDRLLVPQYEEGPWGDWTMEYAPAEAGHCWGYVTGPQAERSYPILKRGGHIWMTGARRETESHAVHLKFATGVVVVCGIGIGLFIHNVIRKPDVHRVFAVDNDQAILDAVRQMSDAQEWQGRDKIKWVKKDALSLTRTKLSQHGTQCVPDYLYVDIWPTMGDRRTVPDTQRIASQLTPMVTGFWGQELAFMAWAKFHRIPSTPNLDEVGLDHFDEWCLWLDLIQQHRSSDYLSMCRVVYQNHEDEARHRSMVRSGTGTLPQVRAQKRRWKVHYEYVERGKEDKITRVDILVTAATSVSAENHARRALDSQYEVLEVITVDTFEVPRDYSMNPDAPDMRVNDPSGL